MNPIYNSFHPFILNIERCKLDNTWNFKNVCSPFFRMFYILDGHGKISDGTETHELFPENLYLTPNFRNYSYSCDSHLEMIYIVFFNLLNQDISISHYHDLSFQSDINDHDRYLFHRILELNPDMGLYDDDPKEYDNWNYLDERLNHKDQMKFQNKIESRGILLQLFSRFIVPNKHSTIKENKSDSSILKTIQFINDNLEKQLTVPELADMAFLSSDYFSKLFLTKIKCRPIEYIQRKRIERAQFLLITTNYSLERIAEQSGLCNASYLSRLFKRHTKMSPGEYRQLEFV